MKAVARWFSRFSLVLAAVAAIAMLFTLVPAPSFAQTPIYKDPEGILAWLKLQMVGVSLAVTLLWKYLPIVKDWSNRALPWLTLAGWVVAQTAGVAAVQAAAPDAAPVVHRSFLHVLGIGIFNSAISKALWDGWLKPTAGATLDRWFLRVPQTP